jgi:hypothetical protein
VIIRQDENVQHSILDARSDEGRVGVSIVAIRVLGGKDRVVDVEGASLSRVGVDRGSEYLGEQILVVDGASGGVDRAVVCVNERVSGAREKRWRMEERETNPGRCSCREP